MENAWPELTESEALSPDEAQIIAVHLHEVRASDDELVANLSREERQRAQRFQVEKPRKQFIAGRAALRMLLGKLLGTPSADVELAYDAQGKPRLRGVSASVLPRFNLAHAEDVVLVAIASGCEIGVDVERVRDVSHMEQIARRYFHSAEMDEILSAPSAERAVAFLRCWTGKEAVIKAIGSGLSESLAAFRVPVQDHQGTWADIPSVNAGNGARCWLQPLWPSPGYVAAVACVGEQRRAACFALRL